MSAVVWQHTETSLNLPSFGKTFFQHCIFIRQSYSKKDAFNFFKRIQYLYKITEFNSMNQSPKVNNTRFTFKIKHFIVIQFLLQSQKQDSLETQHVFFLK